MIKLPKKSNLVDTVFILVLSSTLPYIPGLHGSKGSRNSKQLVTCIAKKRKRMMRVCMHVCALLTFSHIVQDPMYKTW